MNFSISGSITVVHIGNLNEIISVSQLNKYFIQIKFSHFQQFGKILDVEIIFNERGSKVSITEILSDLKNIFLMNKSRI